MFIAIALSIAACQPGDRQAAASSAPTANCRNIPHEGVETQVCGQPQRIVVLGPYVLESLLALGIQPVAFAEHISLHHGNYDRPSQQIPYLGDRITQPLVNAGTAYNPAIEVMLNVKPDLILGTDSNVSQYETLSKIAPTLLLKWDDPENMMRTIAQAVDRSARAEQLLAQTKQQISDARKAFAPLVATHPKLLLLSSSQLQQINLGNSSHGQCSALLEALGFQLVAPPDFDRAATDWMVPVSLETLPQLDQADSIILLGYNSDATQFTETDQFAKHQLKDLEQSWQKNAIAQSLNASKTDRVYFIPSYLCLGFPGAIGTELYLNELKRQLLPK
jgi:iron complex transport system substrate-binding protein